jgi:hypothetical protein
VSAKIRETQGQGSFPESSFKYNPFLHLRVLYTSFTQGLFSSAPDGYRWSPSMQESQIVITDENPIHLEVVGMRPAISFTRGPVQSYNFGMDDMLNYDFETGTKKKTMLLPGTMSINCCSRVDTESEMLAWVVAEQLWMHRELLMQAGFFEIGRQFVVGSPSPAGSIVSGDSADEWFSTTVSSPFQLYRTSQISPLGREIVNHINFSLTTEASRVLNKGLPGTQVPSLPYQVSATAPGVPAKTQPHPLNPAQQVVVRAAYPNRAGLRAPSINGRTIPIQVSTVEQSGTPATVNKSSFKV